MKKKNKKKQNKDTKRGFMRKLIICLAVVLVLATAAGIAFSVFNSGSIKEVKNGELKNENILLSVEKAHIERGIKLSDGLVAVTSNSLISFKPDGSIRSTDKLGYSNPAIKSKGSRYIAFERTTGKYALLNRSGVTYDNKGGDEIINADIAKNGNYALITRKNQSASELSVYSQSNELIFRWECTDEYINQVALSENGKTVAVSAIGVKNGEGYSKLMYFNTDSKDVEGEIEYAGESVYVIFFIGNKEVGIITDLNYMIADLRKMESRVVSYDYDIIKGYRPGESSHMGIMRQEFGTLDKNIITVIDKNAEIIFEKEFEEDIIDFCSDKKNVYVMTSAGINVYSFSSGEERATIKTKGGLNSMIVSDGYIYCFSDTEIYRYKM